MTEIKSDYVVFREPDVLKCQELHVRHIYGMIGKELFDKHEKEVLELAYVHAKKEMHHHAECKQLWASIPGSFLGNPIRRDRCAAEWRDAKDKGYLKLAEEKVEFAMRLTGRPKEDFGSWLSMSNVLRRDDIPEP